jgi:hypothetical protein
MDPHVEAASPDHSIPYAGAARVYRWFDLEDEQRVRCRCGWTGRFRDCLNNQHRDLVDGACPDCRTLLVVRSNPTAADTALASARGDRRATSDAPTHEASPVRASERSRAAAARALEHAVLAVEELRAITASSTTDDAVLAAMGRIGIELAAVRRATSEAAVASGLPGGAAARILRYLSLRPGVVVRQEELAGVAGISEWARRVRELRERGWPIATRAQNPLLQNGEYMLEVSAPALGSRDP